MMIKKILIFSILLSTSNYLLPTSATTTVPRAQKIALEVAKVVGPTVLAGAVGWYWVQNMPLRDFKVMAVVAIKMLNLKQDNHIENFQQGFAAKLAGGGLAALCLTGIAIKKLHEKRQKVA